MSSSSKRSMRSPPSTPPSSPSPPPPPHRSRSASSSSSAMKPQPMLGVIRRLGRPTVSGQGGGHRGQGVAGRRKWVTRDDDIGGGAGDNGATDEAEVVPSERQEDQDRHREEHQAERGEGDVSGEQQLPDDQGQAAGGAEADGRDDGYSKVIDLELTNKIPFSRRTASERTQLVQLTRNVLTRLSGCEEQIVPLLKEVLTKRQVARLVTEALDATEEDREGRGDRAKFRSTSHQSKREEDLAVKEERFSQELTDERVRSLSGFDREDDEDDDDEDGNIDVSDLVTVNIEERDGEVAAGQREEEASGEEVPPVEPAAEDEELPSTPLPRERDDILLSSSPTRSGKRRRDSSTCGQDRKRGKKPACKKRILAPMAAVASDSGEEDSDCVDQMFAELQTQVGSKKANRSSSEVRPAENDIETSDLSLSELISPTADEMSSFNGISASADTWGSLQRVRESDLASSSSTSSRYLCSSCERAIARGEDVNVGASTSSAGFRNRTASDIFDESASNQICSSCGAPSSTRNRAVPAAEEENGSDPAGRSEDGRDGVEARGEREKSAAAAESAVEAGPPSPSIIPPPLSAEAGDEEASDAEEKGEEDGTVGGVRGRGRRASHVRHKETILTLLREEHSDLAVMDHDDDLMGALVLTGSARGEVECHCKRWKEEEDRGEGDEWTSFSVRFTSEDEKHTIFLDKPCFNKFTRGHPSANLAKLFIRLSDPGGDFVFIRQVEADRRLFELARPKSWAELARVPDEKSRYILPCKRSGSKVTFEVRGPAPIKFDIGVSYKLWLVADCVEDGAGTESFNVVFKVFRAERTKKLSKADPDATKVQTSLHDFLTPRQ